MGILDWLFKEQRFKRFEDAFTLTRERLWGALKDSLESPLHADKSIWLVVHFMETFTQLQEQLELWEIEYDVVSSRLDAGKIDGNELLSSSIKLILAELIPEPAEIAHAIQDKERRLAMIVVERHPILEEDGRLHRFAKSLPLKVEFGYYLALDDAVVKLAVNEQTVTVLQQLGLDDHELITSNLVTRRLETVLKRMGPKFSGNTRADSAEEWLLINQETDHEET